MATEKSAISEIAQILEEAALEADMRATDYIGGLGAKSFMDDMRQIQACSRAASGLLSAVDNSEVVVDCAALLALIEEKTQTIYRRLNGSTGNATHM